MWIYWPGFEICKMFQIITDLAKKYQYQSQFALIDMFQKISGRLEKREYQSIFLKSGRQWQNWYSKYQPITCNFKNIWKSDLYEDSVPNVWIGRDKIFC